MYVRRTVLSVCADTNTYVARFQDGSVPLTHLFPSA